MDSIWVLSWKYFDGSAYGIIGCYKKKESADRELSVLEIHGDSFKAFIIEPIPVIAD